MEIRCRKGDCAYNTGCSCSAKCVEVDKAADCKTYHRDELKKSLIIENGNLFEISEELVAKNLRNVPLTCRATNCLYNRGRLCHANGISIIDDFRGDPDGGTETCAPCATYIER